MKQNSDGRRVNRVEKEVQGLVAQYVLQDLRERLPGLVTISHVKMPADLRSAKVFVSVLGTEQERDMVLEILQDKARQIQNYLADQMRSRYCPKLTFYPDKSTESVLKVEKILEDLRQGKTPQESD